jgi:hypothetical protein
MSIVPTNLKYFPTSTTALKPLQEKLKTLDIDSLMEHPDLLELFRAHCLKERSLENIMFLESVYEFEIMSDAKRVVAASQIMDTFFIPGGVFELNLSQSQKDEVTNQIKSNNITPMVFNDVFQSVAFVLKDVWSRFIETSNYRNYKPNGKIEVVQQEEQEDDGVVGKSDPSSPTVVMDVLEEEEDEKEEKKEVVMCRKVRSSMRKSLRKLSSSSDEVDKTTNRKSLSDLTKSANRKSIEKNVIRQLEQEQRSISKTEKKKTKCFQQ